MLKWSYSFSRELLHLKVSMLVAVLQEATVKTKLTV